MRSGFLTDGFSAERPAGNALEWQIAAMRRTLQLMGRPSAADALRALRTAYPESPLHVRMQAIGERQ